MKTIKKVETRAEIKRNAYLKEIASIGPFVEGSLVSTPRNNCSYISHNLTFKVKGKTKSVYVPVDLIEDVVEWTREYRRLKEIMKSVSQMSIDVLQSHVRMKRAEQKRLRRQSKFIKH